ncbi:POT family-domain-containing protein [Xylariaceae sp. FL1651]|nr:POT family-domain-containing protein [Xylariaceae sp. FL1651]
MINERGPVENGDLPLGTDHLAFLLYFASIVNVTERFSYYGLTIPFRKRSKPAQKGFDMLIMPENCVQNPYTSGAHEAPGVLGLDQTAATAINNALFNTLQTIAALFGSVVADGWLGRHNLLLICSLLYLVGNFLLVLVSFPQAIEHEAAPAGFAVSLFLIVTGLGSFQSTVSAFIGDQYDGDGKDPAKKKNDQMYTPDRELTLQFIYNLNYWGPNIGAISGIALMFLELRYGFWAAFLLPLSGLWIAPAVLVAGRKIFLYLRPEENVLLKKRKALSKLIRRRTQSDTNEEPWDMGNSGNDEDVRDVRQTLHICRVLLVFILSYVCVGQSNNNFIAQARQMQTHGLPNDLIWYFNPILVVLLLPLVQWMLSSMASRFRILFGPMVRITIGCLFLVLAVAYVAIVRNLIYNSGPCYEFPTECPAANGGPDEG